MFLRFLTFSYGGDIVTFSDYMDHPEPEVRSLMVVLSLIELPRRYSRRAPRFAYLMSFKYESRRSRGKNVA